MAREGRSRCCGGGFMTLSRALRGTGEWSLCDRAEGVAWGGGGLGLGGAPSTRPAALVDPPETGGLRGKGARRSPGDRGIARGGTWRSPGDRGIAR